MALIKTQLKDALHYMEGLEKMLAALSNDPEWHGGERLWFPSVIELRPDYEGEKPVAWLVGNDFGGYDLVMEDPHKGAK